MFSVKTATLDDPTQQSEEHLALFQSRMTMMQSSSRDILHCKTSKGKPFKASRARGSTICPAMDSMRLPLSQWSLSTLCSIEIWECRRTFAEWCAGAPSKRWASTPTDFLQETSISNSRPLFVSNCKAWCARWGSWYCWLCYFRVVYSGAGHCASHVLWSYCTARAKLVALQLQTRFIHWAGFAMCNDSELQLWQASTSR